MPDSTTIKVSRALRDRLRAVADRRQLTLAAVIEQALDETEERAFWLALSEEHAALSVEQRAEYREDATVGDHLDDETDQAVALRNEW
jgi:predicted transcriptional regulator